jgi:YD repeat-containing protein
MDSKNRRALLIRRAAYAFCVLATLAGASAFSQDREIFADGDTQLLGTDHAGPLGPAFFGDHTDMYSGATTFLVTDVILPGNSGLSVALRRSLRAYDDGIANALPAFPSWTNFEVPYLSGIYKNGPDADAGWRSAYLHTASPLRCSITGGAPEVTQTAGKDDTWEDFEYWRGNHLYLPGGRQEPMLVVTPSDPSNPTSGGPYYWVTKSNWQFSCLSTTANAAGGEGFLGVAPNGAKYFFNWLVNWREAPRLTKESFIGGPTMLSRSEFRMLVTRIEDRFGNWVNYGYSGKNLTSISSNDGRQLTLTYDTSGTRLASATDGTRTWTYSYATGVQVTHPDGQVWSASLSGPGIPRTDGSCAQEPIRYSGEYTVTIQERTGAIGSFNFRPLRRGLAYVPKPLGVCPSPSKFLDGISLYNKTISGPGLTASSWSVIYGPANACYSGQTAECTAASPTTRIVDVLGPQSTFTRFTFGNRYRDTDGMLLQVQTGTSAAAIARNEQLTWTTIPARGIASGGGYLATIQRLPAGRTLTLDGATYSTTLSNYDEYNAPRTIVESGPNGGSRTTQITYDNNKAAWVLGQIAASAAAGDSLSQTFFPNGNVQSATRNGVTVQFTYHPDGNIASITYPRGLTHSYSNYKRRVPQLEQQPEGITITRVVNDQGYVTSQTDGEGHTTGYGYDVMGQVNAIDFPIGNDATVVRTALSTTFTRGPFSSVVSYDGLRRATRVSSSGIATGFEYDAYNRATFRSNPGDSIGTRVEYDVLGRPKKVTNPDGTFSSYAYGAGSVTSTDERGRNTTRTFRAYGDPDTQLLMSTTTPVAAANVSITRLANGLIDTVTQSGFTRDFDYDSRNYLQSETNPETGVTTYVRDDAGNVTRKTIGGLQTAYTYDGQNRLQTITYPDATPAVTVTYSKTNRLKSGTSSLASRVLTYDENDNLRTESLTVDGNTLAATYGYTANDQLSSITYPVSGRTVNYSPDALGRPTQVSGYVSSITYWGNGLLRDVTYSNGLVNHYDKNERLLTSALQARRGSTYYLNSSYDYDDVGNLLSVSDPIEPALNRSLDYDGIDRVTTANGPWGTGSITYDGAGNIRSQSLGSFGLTYFYDAQNRLQSVAGSRNQTFSYDAQGNVAAAGSSTFVYNAASTLTCALCSSAQPINYAYDALNQRVKVTKAGVTTYEFYSSGGDLLVSYTASQANKLIEYIYLDGKRIAQRVSDTAPATSITPIATSLPTNASGGISLGVNLGGSAPTGTVTFSRAGTALGTAYVASNQASVEVLGLAAGPHTITATYSGDANNSGNSLAYGITVIDTVPSSISVPASSSSGSYTISWGTAGGTVTAYQLYEATNTSFTGQISAYSGTGTSVALTGRGNGTYYYRVRACNGAACSAYRTGANAITVTLPPGVPASLTTPPTSATGSYSVSWSAASGTLTAYELYEANNAAFTGQVKVYTGASTTAALSGRGDGVYYYRVRACNGSVCSGYQPGANATTVTLPPGVPTSIAVPSTSTTGSYFISWGASSGAVTAYELYEATNSGFTGQALVYSGTATSAGLSGRTDGSYYYRVRACNGSGCSGYRTGANAISVTLPPGIPGSISVPSSSPNGSYTISWGGASGAVSTYQLYEATNSGFSGETLVYNAAGLSAGFTSKPNGTYYYRVRACNASGCSGFRTGSNAITVATLQAVVNPTHWNYYVMRGSNPIIDPPVVVTASGGTGGYTYQWERVSGDGAITAQTPTASSTKWTRSLSGWDVVFIAYWRCLVRDSAGNTAYTQQVQVEFEREDHQ